MTATPKVLVRKRFGPKPIDRTGLRVGRLLVVDEAPRGANGKAEWNCVCDCGNTCVVAIKSLLEGLVGRGRRSCGCMMKEVYESWREAGRQLALAPPATKTCPRCGYVGHRDEFYNDKRRLDKKFPYCKPCVTTLTKARYERDYRKINAVNARWYWQNRDLALARSAVWREVNKEKKRKADLAWRVANPDKKRHNTAMRRARVAAAGGTISPGFIQKLLKLQRGKCACCGKPLGKKYHLDHIIPLIRGGRNDDHNVQLLRARCNLQKHSKDPIEFMQRHRGRLL